MAAKNEEMTGKSGHELQTPPALEALWRNAKLDGETRSRPVDKWNPPYCGDIGLKIRRDGVWLYQGSPIGRLALVKLFASILRKDADGKTYVVTPVEKILVDVEDAPYLGVELAVDGAGEMQTLMLRTNLDDVVPIDAEHPLRFMASDPDGGLKPYVRLRGRLEALCTRAVYFELVELASERNGEVGLWSGGVWWPIVGAGQ